MIKRKTLYFAAPLFSVSERAENDRLCKRLERWCDIFLPQRDGELVPHLIQRGLTRAEAYKVVFERDLNAIKTCDALIINLDGRTVDEGAAFELGVAYALSKPCVGYHTDSRVLLSYGINPMIEVPLTHTFACLETLEGWTKEFSLTLPSLRPRLVS